MTVPQREYARRLSDRETTVSLLRARDDRVSNLRLALGVAAIAAACMALYSQTFSSGWVAVVAALFVVAVVYHHSIRHRLGLAERAANFYRNGLARVEDRWAGTGQRGERFDDPHHVYASDLDLFGKGGLFELLSSARTRMGEETLAHWLLRPSAVGAIRDRHICITELQERLDLREALAVLGAGEEVVLRPERLLQWAEDGDRLASAGIFLISVLLPLSIVAATAVWIIYGLALPALVILLLEGIVTMLLKKRVAAALSGTENSFEDLRLLAGLLGRLEQESFQSVPMKAVMQTLTSSALPASIVVGRLGTIANLAESRRNMLLAVLEVPLLYSLQVALAAERWRRTHGAAIRAWLEAIGQVEALISLAAYRYEHPDDPFPEFIAGDPQLHGDELGHPLIPRHRCVRNSISLGGKSKVLLVSGSNMSGKSTLLRTVGINTVLAMAGAPVRARSMRMTPLQVGASIRVNDSLHEGSSRFYAEITRLRQLADLRLGEPKLLFLLDELLQGTNSRDRHAGAQAILHAMMAAKAIGLASTHDLALTEIPGVAEGMLRNVHFQDEIVDGELEFDFRLREGVVTKSNAIALMRSIGLDV